MYAAAAAFAVVTGLLLLFAPGYRTTTSLQGMIAFLLLAVGVGALATIVTRAAHRWAVRRRLSRNAPAVTTVDAGRHRPRGRPAA